MDQSFWFQIGHSADDAQRVPLSGLPAALQHCHSGAALAPEPGAGRQAQEGDLRSMAQEFPYYSRRKGRVSIACGILPQLSWSWECSGLLYSLLVLHYVSLPAVGSLPELKRKIAYCTLHSVTILSYSLGSEPKQLILFGIELFCVISWVLRGTIKKDASVV